MKKPRILIVDDERDMLGTCARILGSETAEIHTEDRSPVAARRIAAERFDVLIADLSMPEMDGMALLERVRSESPGTVVLMLTGFPTVETAVESVRKGAFDYITKPFTPDQLRVAVSRALMHRQLREEHDVLKQEGDLSERFDHIIGRSPRMLAVFRLIEQIGAVDSDVLLVGESGTGKELIARSLHSRGTRKNRRMVPVDCGSIPENLLENEFFGHEGGAYTGAQGASAGLLEFAHQGTLFLDEICELTPPLQAKFLRVLQERQFRRIGGRELIQVDLRVIAATNRDIELEVREKRFREDLFYRINVLRIDVPPLRERAGDVPLLVAHFLDRYAGKWESRVRGIERDALEVLCRYPWPGNVRELQNVLQRAIVACGSERIMVGDLPAEVFEAGRADAVPEDGFFALRDREVVKFEEKYLRDILTRHRGDVAKAAEDVRLPRGTLYRLLKKYGIRPESFRD